MSLGTLHEIAVELNKTMQCNCDLDKWEPERSTGHSFVCRIHKAAKEVFRYHPTKRPVVMAKYAAKAEA